MNLSGTKKAPSAKVVLPHYAFGALSFFVLSLLILFFSDAFEGHYFNPHLLSITHVAALGWISMVIFGALYQLIPVIMLAELFSEKLAQITFWLFASGISLLCYSFADFNTGIIMQIAAILVLLAVLLFASNVFFTARKSDEKNLESEFITASVFWLVVTVILGTLLVFNFSFPFLTAGHLHFLKIHSHVGFAGWFILLIMGVGSKLIPMFLLSSPVQTKKLKIAYYALNLSLLAFFSDALIFQTTTRALIYFIVALIGIISFILFIRQAFISRARRILDTGMKHSILSFLFLIIPVVSGIILHGGFLSSENSILTITIVYGVSIIFGFITLLVLGQTFKTLPFIVWLHKYKSGNSGQRQILPKDMYSEKMLKIQLYLFIVAYFTLQAGILTRNFYLLKVGGGLFTITAFMYAFNVFKVLFHSIKNIPNG